MRLVEVNTEIRRSDVASREYLGLAQHVDVVPQAREVGSNRTGKRIDPPKVNAQTLGAIFLWHQEDVSIPRRVRGLNHSFLQKLRDVVDDDDALGWGVTTYRGGIRLNIWRDVDLQLSTNRARRRVIIQSEDVLKLHNKRLQS